MDVLVLLANVAAVLFMASFIWAMQLVHYPLFDRVGADAFPAYKNAHNRLFFLVAGQGYSSLSSPGCCSSYDPLRSRSGPLFWGWCSSP